MKTLFVAAVMGICVLSSVPAGAETISFAAGYDRLAKDCGRDIEKLCGNVKLGGGGVKACLEHNRAKLSPGCRVTQAETFALLTKRLQAQATAVQVCDRDRGQYCRGVQPNDGNQLSCLLKASKVVSGSCKQVIVDAGWND